MDLTVEVKDALGNIVYTTVVTVEQGKQGGFLRWLDASLDEVYSTEDC